MAHFLIRLGLSIMQNWMTRHKICSSLIHTPLVGIKQSHLLNLNSQIACFIHKIEWIQLLKKPKNIADWCHTLKEFNDYLSASAIDLKKFQDLYGIPYFDLTNQEEELKSGSTKIEFKYTLSDNPGNPFSFLCSYSSWRINQCWGHERFSELKLLDIFNLNMFHDYWKLCNV